MIRSIMRVAALAAAGVMLAGCAGESNAPTTTGPIGSTGATQPPEGLAVPWIGPKQEQARQASQLLARAPWLYQPNGSPNILSSPGLGAIEFPRGTTYAEALYRLYVWVTVVGTLPRGVRVVPSLSVGTVLTPPTATRGPIVDLRAPFGYDPATGAISPPMYAVARNQDVSAKGYLTWPPGSRFDVPTLPACMVAVAGSPTRRCTAQDHVLFSDRTEQSLLLDKTHVTAALR